MSTPPSPARRSRLLPLVAVMLVVLVLAVSSRESNELPGLLARTGSWAPLAYVIVKVFFFVAAPLTSLPLQLYAAATFGLVPAALYTLLATLIGGSINFWLARRLGRPAIERLQGSAVLHRLDTLATRFASWPELLVARVFLSPVYDFISYAVGLTQLPYRHYLIVSALGGSVPTFIWATFGASLSGDGLNIMMAAIGVAVFVLMTMWVKRRFGDLTL